MRFHILTLAIVAAGCSADSNSTDDNIDREGGSARAAEGKMDDLCDPRLMPCLLDGGTAPNNGLAVLGWSTHTPDFVHLEELANADDTLSTPRDLAVHPTIPGQVWVVNETTSVTILFGIDTARVRGEARGWHGADHFLTRPAGIAFGQRGRMATAPETDHITQPSTPADFMGPTLWPSDETVFDAGHASHLDMLHNSPNSVGIAWEGNNVYWVVDGAHKSLTRYDFQYDHGPGGDDHTDGIVLRYAEGMFGYVKNVSSGIEMDREAGVLYLADTGNNRIVTFDPESAQPYAYINPNYDGSRQYAMQGGELTMLVDGAEHDLVLPSGLALYQDHVFITDNATSRIYAFTKDDGALVDYLDLSSIVDEGGLMGIDIDAEGNVLVVDAVGNRVLRIGKHRH